MDLNQSGASILDLSTVGEPFEPPESLPQNKAALTELLIETTAIGNATFRHKRQEGGGYVDLQGGN